MNSCGTRLDVMAFASMDRHQHPCVVVVVEDEALIRMAAAYALEDAEYAVIEADCADKAVEILKREAASIHAVFTDVNMPGTMNGIELAHHVRRHWPHIGLLAASGRSTIGAAHLPRGSRFVSKPYDLDEVVRHISDLTPDHCP
jgi:DNA-binding NtrC family response regulator